MPGRLHVDQDEADAHLLLGGLVRAGQAEDPVGILAQRGPGLLAVHHVMVAVPHGRGAEAGQVRPGAGLAEPLAPPDVQVGGGRQELLLVRLRPELRDDRADHVGVEAEGRRHAGLLHLVLVDIHLHRRPILAAPLLGPVRHRQAGGVQDALRRHLVVAGDVLAALHLLADALRDLGGEELAHLGAEGAFLGGEAQVHVRPPVLPCGCPPRYVPAAAALAVSSRPRLGSPEAGSATLSAPGLPRRYAPRNDGFLLKAVAKPTRTAPRRPGRRRCTW